jgi:hypothetical protein
MNVVRVILVLILAIITNPCLASDATEPLLLQGHTDAV